MESKLSYSRGMTNGMVVLGMLLLAGIVTVAILRDRIVNQPYNQVSVTGTGKVAYTPDMAIVTLGVHVDAGTAQLALSQLNSKMAGIVPAIVALGIPAEQVTTNSYTLVPQYYYPVDMPAQISGYTADQQIVVKVTGETMKDMVSKVVETATANGANQVQGVSFEVSNVEDLKQQALALAIADARARAEGLAKAADVDLDDVVGWWENPIYVPGPIPMYNYGYGGDMGGGMAPTIPSGGQEVIMQVNLNYSVN